MLNVFETRDESFVAKKVIERLNAGEDPTPQARQTLAAVRDEESKVRAECK